MEQRLTAVAHGLANARKVPRRVKNGEANYHFIEIMCCPGGCVGGGGQPILSASGALSSTTVKKGKAIYEVDRNMPLRKSHENPPFKCFTKYYLDKP